MIFDLRGSEQQQRIAADAIASCDFPFDRLTPGLTAAVGRTNIPVVWEDLSRYAAGQTAEAHPVYRGTARARVLGLAWYSGRISLDLSLQNDERLAHEVFLAEVAHMADFFYLTDSHRRAIVNALHRDQIPDWQPVGDAAPLGLDGHACGWFDVGPYSMWVGEAMMEAFVEAFSPVAVTIQLDHPVSPVQAAYIRRVLLGPALVGTKRGKVYHLPTCPLIRPSWVLTPFDWPAPLDAERDGRRACRVCRPGS